MGEAGTSCSCADSLASSPLLLPSNEPGIFLPANRRGWPYVLGRPGQSSLFFHVVHQGVEQGAVNGITIDVEGSGFC